MASRGKIPDRWIPYKACGNVIEGTKIICFKVPINKRVQESVPEIKKIWDISAVLAEIPKLCAVIDLTNTARYYDPREFERANVRHKKIFMPGREIPPESKVQEFMDAVDEFQGRDCDSVVGVHCTHGLNRTGYMVCRYMRDRLNIPADLAIKRFEIARGYEIERENYKADLLGIKNIPRSDFGKATVIRPINKEDNGEESRDYNNRYSDGWHTQRYDLHGRCSDDRNGGRYGDDRNGGRYGEDRNGGRYSEDRNGGRYGDNRNGGRYGDDRNGGRYRDGRNGGSYGASSRFSTDRFVNRFDNFNGQNYKYNKNRTSSERDGYLSWRNKEGRQCNSETHCDSNGSSSGRSEDDFSYKHDY